MPYVPDTVSYGSLLVIINDRLKQKRSLEDQRYFVDLANELIRLYWQEMDEDEEKHRPNAA